jgi:hypothetical protein
MYLKRDNCPMNGKNRSPPKIAKDIDEATPRNAFLRSEFVILVQSLGSESDW